MGASVTFATPGWGKFVAPVVNLSNVNKPTLLVPSTLNAAPPNIVVTDPASGHALTVPVVKSDVPAPQLAVPPTIKIVTP